MSTDLVTTEESNLSRLSNDVTGLIAGINPDSSPDDVARMRIFLSRLKEMVRELDAQFTDGPFLEWLEADGGRELEIGSKRYFSGTVKKEKDRDVSATLKCVRAVGADDAQLATLLSSNAFKLGALKAYLAEKGYADVAEDLIETTIEKDVKTGAPRKAVREINEQFVK